MAKKKGIDIHHPNMIKTVFIMTSLAILAFLALIVKTTSFKSEPKAAQRTLSRASLIKKFYEVTAAQCATKYKYSSGSYFTLVNEDRSCPSHTFNVGRLWNDIKQWQWYGNWKDLNFLTNKYLKCCVNMAGYISESDQYCSSMQIYDSNKNPLGTKDMKCKPNCAYSSITDKNNEYKINSYYFIPTGSNTIKQITNSICTTAEMKYGEYKRNYTGTCCSKN